MKFTYLLLNIFTISYPLVRSFEDRVRFHSGWKHLFPAIFITGAIFILWDETFTRMGVWSFNPEFVTGIFIGSLPLEEWLFFLTVPFSCIFIFEVLSYFFPSVQVPRLFNWLHPAVAVLLILIAAFYHDRIYTFVACLTASLVLFIHHFAFPALSRFRFWFTYAVCLVPFLLVNGILTALPVVEYHPSGNSGIRIGTIPAEDLAYCLSLLLINLMLYETFRKRTKTT